MWIRLVAILVGIAVMLTLEQIFALQWYWAAPPAVLAYLLVRYVAYALSERRATKATIEEAARAAERGPQNTP